jgi:hypothetical protein
MSKNGSSETIQEEKKVIEERARTEKRQGRPCRVNKKMTLSGCVVVLALPQHSFCSSDTTAGMQFRER